MQVSNIVFDFDGSEPTGSRVIRDSVQIGEEPLDLERMYVIGTKDYLISGKDGYDCFTEVRTFSVIPVALTVPACCVTRDLVWCGTCGHSVTVSSCDEICYENVTWPHWSVGGTIVTQSLLRRAQRWCQQRCAQTYLK